VIKRKLYGQHFLVDEKVIKKIVELIDGETALEIGGGKGALSKLVANKVEKLYIVEKDEKLAETLRNIFQNKENIKVINDDFLKLKPFKVHVIYGNVPYSISSKIVFKLLEWNFSYSILMFQKEFVEKMIAKEKTREFGRLSFNSQNFFVIKKLFDVSNKAFFPKPKVTSTVIKLEKREKPLIEVKDERIIRVLFSLKNKKIKNIIKKMEKTKIPIKKEELEKNEIKKIMEKRPWQLTFEEIDTLLKIFN